MGTLGDKRLSWESIRAQLSLKNRATARTIYHNYATRGSVHRRKGNGRPTKVSEHGERLIKRIVINNQRLSAEKIRVQYNSFSSGPSVFTKTVRRLLKRANLVGRAAAKKISIKAVNRRLRKKCATLDYPELYPIGYYALRFYRRSAISTK